MDRQKFCLKWDGFQSSVTSVFDNLRQDGELVDITLCCEGERVKAHRMMLSACSPYFRELLKNNQCQQMVIFLKDTTAADLHAIIEFMYKGSVNVGQTQLASFIKTAETLQIRGLSGDDDKQTAPPVSRRPPPSPRPHRPATPPAKRRRTSGQERAELARSPAPAAAAEPPLAAPLPRHAADSPLSSSNQSAPSPAPPPPAPPPPPPPPPVSIPAAAPPPAAPHEVKVEKVDLTVEDDVSLDATLDYVAEYEGEYEEADLSMVSMAGHDVAMAGDAALAMGGLAGPSQRLAEDGSAQGGDGAAELDSTFDRTTADNPVVWRSGAKLNRRRPAVSCQLCGRKSSNAFSLRRHMRLVHKLTPEQVLRLVPFTRFRV